MVRLKNLWCHSMVGEVNWIVQFDVRFDCVISSSSWLLSSVACLVVFAVAVIIQHCISSLFLFTFSMIMHEAYKRVLLTIRRSNAWFPSTFLFNRERARAHTHPLANCICGSFALCLAFSIFCIVSLLNHCLFKIGGFGIQFLFSLSHCFPMYLPFFGAFRIAQPFAEVSAWVYASCFRFCNQCQCCLTTLTTYSTRWMQQFYGFSPKKKKPNPKKRILKRNRTREKGRASKRKLSFIGFNFTLYVFIS